MKIVPCSLAEANAFVKQHHRHHGKVAGHKFSIAIADDDSLIRGVAIVGRPVSRMLDRGWTLEVLRCCTDGITNGCSMLYRAAWRAVVALGYTKLITYILDSEKGSSLNGAGFRCVGSSGGGKWDRVNRPRFDTHPLQGKLRWEIERT